MQSVDPDLIIATARETLGTPFRHQGRINGLALDCIGVAQYVAAKLNLPHIDQNAYPAEPYQGLLEKVLEDQPCLQRVYQMQPGDLLLIRFVDDPQHIAIFTGENIIHGYSNIGRVVEHIFDPQWQARVVRIYRFIQPE